MSHDTDIKPNSTPILQCNSSLFSCTDKLDFSCNNTGKLSLAKHPHLIDKTQRVKITRLLVSGRSPECSDCLLRLWSSNNMKK